MAERYRILRKLGEGGMGSVYLAEHTTINKKLAIKVLSPEYSHKQDLVERFLQEARAASMIEQENVVEITDFGSTPAGSVFFVMEYLQGEDLGHTIHREGPLPWDRACTIVLQICEALAAAHDAGIVHRDMKPENCYRVRRGSNQDFIKVLDFGIAKVTSEEGEARGLTRTGMIFGTPEYMSPEQAKGERVDHRSDVYSVGVILFELLTGKVPFTADTFMGILTKHMFEAPPAPRQVAPAAEISPEAEAVVLKALQKDRALRFQSMREMARAVAAVGTGAEPVEVVSEAIAAPSAGRITFSQNSTQLPIPVMDEPEPRTAKHRPLWLGLGSAAVLGAAVTVAVFGTDEGDAPVAPTPVQQVAAVQTEAPEPMPREPAQPEPPTVATVMVSTPGIEGEVLDGRDFGRLGSTNAPIELPVGDTALTLVVRAQGYEDARIEVVPNRDKTLDVALTILAEPAASSSGKKRRASKRSKKRRARASKPQASVPAEEPASEPETPEPQSKPVPKPKPKPRTSADLKDPFSN